MLNLFRILISLIIFLVMLQQPQAALLAAQNALGSWWRNVLPALLPFFILTEFLSRCGFIRALSIWLEPVMQPLFRLPGAAALGIILGFFAGSPTGGAIAGQLRSQGLVSRNEGERLCAFCNNAGPLYIMITVTAALQEPALGVWLALAHYPLNLLGGLLLRFFSSNTNPPAALNPNRPSSCRQLLLAGWQAAFGRQQAVQPLSQILKESSFKALNNIGMIGAFMLIFSLLLLTLRQTGILSLLQLAMRPLCQLFGLPPEVLPALSEGFFEMTLGIDTLAACSAPLPAKLLSASIILGWSGLSIHTQIAGVLNETDLTLKYYLPCRLLHSLAAPALLLLCQKYGLISLASIAAPLWPLNLAMPGVWQTLAAWLLGSLLCLCVLLICSFLIVHDRTHSTNH